MPIALTGGSGFIGKWILRQYGDVNDFIIMGRNRSTKEMSVNGAKFRYLFTDYSVESLMTNLRDTDAVIHLAAKRTGLNRAWETFQHFIPNVEIASSVFEACRLLNIKNIINMSSIGVYGIQNPLPWSEEHKVRPETYYGLSKATIEDVSEYYNRKHGMAIKTLRMAQVLGAGEREGFMLMIFIRKALNKETLTLFGAGEGRREYIYVKDVTNAIMAGLNKPNVGGVFNIGSGNNTSHKELAETINKIFDNVGNLAFLKDTVEDKSQHLMSVEKAREELNWQPKWTLEQALKDMKEMLTGM